MKQVLRILNLEDDPIDSELTFELLNADGLITEIDRVDTFAGFKEALERGSYALILSDYTIPGVDSLEALHLARQMRPEIPFIFLSGTMGEEQAIETLKMGASDYVIKQRIARLAPAVRRALQEAEEQSRRRRAEEELRKAHDELERRVEERAAQLVEANEILKHQAALLDLAHDAIMVRDLHRRVIYWNSGAERTYGWKKGEAEGKIIHELLGTQFPLPLEEIESTVLETGAWQGELLHMTREGSQLVVESRWALQRDENGIPMGMLEINRDITERKTAESSLKQYAERLEQSNRILQDFAFVASHDLQEPLRKIQTFGERLKKKFTENLGPEGHDYIERMQNAAVRMQTLIGSLLEYSRLTTKTEPFVSVHLDKVVKEVLTDLEVSIHEAGGRVEIGELPHLQADPSQMRQLFQNLIGNGLKFHGKENPVVKVYGKPCRNGTCEIFVEDNGIGFDEKYLDRIFAPFQRLHGRSSRYKGSGMGLAICRKIMDRHNGDITARSTQGEGSTFVITLPLKQSCS